MIKNIIFDLGGVVLNIDFQRSADEFHKLGVSNFDKLYSRAVQNSLFEDVEMGIIDADEFRKQIRLLSKLNLSDQEIDKAWNAIILDFPNERLKLIQQISKNYSCYLLSNTNKIHYDVYQADLKNNHAINGLESLFIKTWFSHDLKMRKPNLDIFEFALTDGGLKPEETLFIDDSIQNIDAAKKLGIRTLFIDVENGDEISNHFKNGKVILQ
jgi:putative hydrolase of the HAD superfamily